MKLGLLVVVAVAILLPNFSESQIVSKCELRDKLGEMIKLPRGLEDRILSTLICEVDRRSHLNTTLVTVFGKRIPTTPKPTVITVPSTTGVNNMTTEAATIQPTSANSTTTQLTNTTTAMTTITSPATTNSIVGSMNTTLVSNSTGGGNRQKREADSSSEEENKFNEEEMVQDYSQMEDEDETSTEDEISTEEDPGYNMEPWSLGLYGLFQLSDKHFCDSGYRWSRNVCCTSCTAFADDDITDDIACVIKTGYWRQILGSASYSCRHASNFFKESN